jgi:preprotein translocase SecE subunit
MAFNIYKSGQGYWTRVLSGVGGGVLLLAAVTWLWDKLSTLPATYGLYVQAAVALVSIAIGGFLLFYAVASKPRTCDFLIATEGEMKKVNWPTRREVIGSTWVVICCIVMFSLILFFSDYIFAWFFQLIGVLVPSTT